VIEGVGVEPATIGHNKHKHPIQKILVQMQMKRLFH